MRRHVIAAAVAAGLVVTAIPSDAGARPQLTDPTGDAVIAGADIVSATFESTFKKKVRTTKKGKKKVKKIPTGFTLSLRLAAAPANDIWYEVSAVGPGCTEFNFDYSTSRIGEGPVGAGCAGTTSTDYIDGIRPRAAGSTIKWTVPTSAIPVGSKFSSITAVAYQMTTAPASLVSLGFPAWDEAEAPAGRTFVVGK